MTDSKPLDTIKTLLTTSWVSANTDGITPIIKKKYELPKNYKLDANKDLIYVYSITSNLAPSGIGEVYNRDIIETISIDIRSRPSYDNIIDDSHARKVLKEVKRILVLNTIDPDSTFDNIDPNITIQDLSNNSIGIFRYVLDVNLNVNCKNITS